MHQSITTMMMANLPASIASVDAIVVRILLVICFLTRNVHAASVTTKFNVLIPQELSIAGGYEHREALFGVDPYGGSIQQQVYYAGTTFCTSDDINPKGGFPKRKDHSAWKSPFILMIDRGDCSFVQKVRNAQRVGASAVLIADNLCFCEHENCVNDENPNAMCEPKEPIMADDGSGSDISIPSFLLFKEDADPIKQALKKGTHVRAQMSFSVPAPDARVEYDLWTSPADFLTRELFDDFFAAAQALSSHAYFTPHMYIYNGTAAGCHLENGQDVCGDLCSNGGRYCSIDIDLDSGASGTEVVNEALRRMCLWDLYGKENGVGMPWWNYVREFLERCDSGTFMDLGSVFSDEDCVAKAMKAAGVDKALVDQCMADSGGTKDNIINPRLDKELEDQATSGVVLVPSLIVNSAIIRGYLNFGTAFTAICAGFASGTAPPICDKCANCHDEMTCVSKGKCVVGGGFFGGDGVSPSFFLGSLAVLLLTFSIVAYVQHRRQENYMQEQIRGVVAEYMPVELQNRHANTSLALDEDEGNAMPIGGAPDCPHDDDDYEGDHVIGEYEVS